MEKVLGIFGGTFDPIHRCHLSMASTFLSSIPMQKLLIIPAGKAYHKNSSLPVTPAQHRYRMCELAFAGFPKTTVSSIDLKREGDTYTYHTLLILQKFYPDYQFLWLLGSDAFRMLPLWYKYEQVAKMTSFVVVLRAPDQKKDIINFSNQLPLPINYQCLDFKGCHLSASNIKEAIRNQTLCANDLPKPVLSYIKEHHLYGL